MKNIYFIVLSVLIMFYILFSVRKNKLSIKTSFLWMIASLAMLLLSIFPKSMDWFATFLGIAYPPALFLTICIIFLVIQNFNFSKRIYDLHERIIDLTEEISVLKGEKK